MKSIATQRNDENLREPRSFNLLITEKNQYNQYKCRCQDRSRMIQARM